MKEEVYLRKRRRTKEKYEATMNKIDTEYALEQSVAKIGDIITDHYHSIKVEKIILSGYNVEGFPTCIYSGFLYSKKGVPHKKGGKSLVWQNNIEFINNEEVK